MKGRVLVISTLALLVVAFTLLVGSGSPAYAATYVYRNSTYSSGGTSYYRSGSGYSYGSSGGYSSGTDYSSRYSSGGTTYYSGGYYRSSGGTWYRSGNTYIYRPAPQPQVPSQPAPPSGPQRPPLPQTPPTTGLTSEEQMLFDLINQERAKAGVPPLALDMRLVELARKKSQDMVANNYFSHYSPTYGSPFDMLNQAGISYRAAGENLAGANSVSQAHAALMNSSGHRANILNPNYTHVGVGIATGGPYGKMFTELFIATW